MKRLFVCLTALIMLLTASASAEMVVEVIAQGSHATLSAATNCYYQRTKQGYVVFDADGNALSDAYPNIESKAYGLYYEYYGKGLNYIGLMDSQARVLCEPSYGVVNCYGSWALAYVLAETDEERGDFRDNSGNRYNAQYTDVYHDGKLLGSLSREQYIPSTWDEGTTAGYLYLKSGQGNGMYIDGDFNIITVPDKLVTSEFTQEYEKGAFHNPTQQWAYIAGCTLTPEDVTAPVFYHDKSDSLLDLQGNVIKTNVLYDGVRAEGDYFSIRKSQLYGIMDLQGNVIVDTIYKQLGGEDLFLSEYQPALTQEGHLHFLDKQGNVVARAEYPLDANRYRGFASGALFACVDNMGQYLIITATHGELPTMYQDVKVPRAGQEILVVKKDGKWGAIDLAGNTVIPFVHDIQLDISHDGTLLIGKTKTSEWTIYKVTGSSLTAPVAAQTTPAETAPVAEEAVTEPTETAPVLQDGQWACSCGAVNSTKFCPECGQARPAEPQCTNCGYKPEGAAPKFCPDCGTKF